MNFRALFTRAKSGKYARRGHCDADPAKPAEIVEIRSPCPVTLQNVCDFCFFDLKNDIFVL
jgi:hypothetical protein